MCSGHPLATEAGLGIMRAGGNAVDAAVATGLALGVVDPKNSGIGGGCFILIRLANGGIVAVDGRETAPLAATPAMFLKDGEADSTLSQTGPLASGVPGAMAAYDFALRNYGNKSLEDVMAPAIHLASEGFEVDESLASAVRNTSKDLGRFPSSSAIFLPGGKPFKAGYRLRQPDLAESYSEIARQGIDWFYKGEFAKSVGNWMKENGGLLTAADFAGYRVAIRPPVVSQYRDFTILGFPPPSSGGVHVAQIMNILEGFHLAERDDAARLHLMAEAMKLAFADRAYWLGDPAFTDVPRGLLSKEYAERLAAKINLDSVGEVKAHSVPPASSTDLFPRHTTHFCTADREGNWVSCTATINTTLGSKVVVPGTGVVLNNQMDDFSIAVGVSNFFGLIGGKANAVAPGKRPLSSMSPTIVLKEGRPLYAIGAAGGPKIISQVAGELVALLELGMSVEEAAAMPRIHHQWKPEETAVESAVPNGVRRRLIELGHHVEISPSMGISHLIGWTEKRGFVGAPDPRGSGKAGGL